ncbi:hypothetical protein EC973_002707 [Apophysomyces ossiformis]|uniref:Transcriptional regulatory protein RXT2 N-terminal domain-containing protein n=1 Tax=Apophysomyces ossiformis TaxID=679940 RepID=A0A8H7EME7_9FUNG|nr:hypothetical protein EC973_002707 [Apophysomyces ossiformis]
MDATATSTPPAPLSTAKSMTTLSTTTNTTATAATNPSANTTLPSLSSMPAAAKWIQENEDSDSDQKWATSDAQFGGNKLRAPKPLQEETEYTNAGKTRTVIKRKRKRLDEEISDEESDPYSLINIEESWSDILSPIESPTDIVRRPALHRILKSRQIEALACSAMEFIESEKNFNKILSRLSAILHQDDPRYLDLTFERPPEKRKRKEEEGGGGDEKESSHSGEDIEAIEAVRRVRELLLENINFSNEYLQRLQGARDKLCKAHMQKTTLWKQLKSNSKEQDKRPSKYRDDSGYN